MPAVGDTLEIILPGRVIRECEVIWTDEEGHDYEVVDPFTDEQFHSTEVEEA